MKRTGVSRPFRRRRGCFLSGSPLACEADNSAPLLLWVCYFLVLRAVRGAASAGGVRGRGRRRFQKPEKGAKPTRGEPYTVHDSRDGGFQRVRVKAEWVSRKDGKRLTSVRLLRLLLRAVLSGIRLLLSKRLLSLLSVRRLRGLLLLSGRDR